MRLAFCSPIPFWQNGSVYSTNNNYINFLLSLQSYVDEFHLFVPLLQTNQEGRYIFSPHKSEVFMHGLPPIRRASELYQLKYLARIPHLLRLYKRHLHNWDLGWLEVPHLPAVLFYAAAKVSSKDMILHIRSNLEEEVRVRQMTNFSYIAKWGFRALESIMVKHTPTIVVGRELYDKHRTCDDHLHCVITNLISEDMIISRQDLQVPSLVNSTSLLFVGRLTSEKGIKYLVESVSLLAHQYRQKDLTLNIVGEGQQHEHIAYLAEDLQVVDNIRFSGYIPFGADLFAVYRSADIFVLPSLTEGVPKVLLEAMSNGVPVICTDLGGISSLITHKKNGFLVKPADSRAIAEAVIKLQTNSTLYRRLARNGLETARRYSFENQSRKVVKILKRHFPYYFGDPVGEIL